MEFSKLINMRESCRNYDSGKKVDTELLKKCVEMACLAPSACNSQPWRYVIINNEELCAKIAKGVQDNGFNSFASGAPAFIVVYGEDAKMAKKFDGLIADNNSFRDNDLGIGIAYLTLAASDNGLSTCIMGWRNDSKINEALGQPLDRKVHCVIAVGYSLDEAPRKKKRKSLKLGRRERL